MIKIEVPPLSKVKLNQQRLVENANHPGLFIDTIICNSIENIISWSRLGNIIEFEKVIIKEPPRENMSGVTGIIDVDNRPYTFAFTYEIYEQLRLYFEHNITDAGNFQSKIYKFNSWWILNSFKYIHIREGMRYCTDSNFFIKERIANYYKETKG